MIRIIELILDKGFGYVRDGSVYFSIDKFKDYGKLSGTNVQGVKAGARVDVDEAAAIRQHSAAQCNQPHRPLHCRRSVAGTS